MAITANYEQTRDIIPEGVYEFLIGAASRATTKGGTDYISIPLTIRKDVEQPQKGRVLYHAIWKKHEPNNMDAQIGGYNFGSVMAILKNAGIPAGTEFDSLKEMFVAVEGKPIRGTVTHDEYNGRTSAKISTFAPSQIQTVSTGTAVKVDDLPF